MLNFQRQVCDSVRPYSSNALRANVRIQPHVLKAKNCHVSWRLLAVPSEDASIKVKISLAESSGKLDLSECELLEVPSQVFELEELEELSLAGNMLQSLPPEIGKLKSLRRLQLSGNRLRTLPEEIGCLESLEGLWLHGNLVRELPESIGDLSVLKILSLGGNLLTHLPSSVASLASLKELTAPGNKLIEIPEQMGQMSALEALELHGNNLVAFPERLNLFQLKKLWLHGNGKLQDLAADWCNLTALQELSVADCSLSVLPKSLSTIPSLKTISCYGNKLECVPEEILQSENLKYLWLEGNPLNSEFLRLLISAVMERGEGYQIKVGLDSRQFSNKTEINMLTRFKSCQISEMCGNDGPGYFKLERANLSGERGKVLVVAFGSAPGVPNWGGILNKIRASAETEEEMDFDVLYVVDPGRDWYGGGSDAHFEYWESRLFKAVRSYNGDVIMIGDSMGATAALMFSGMASSVHAFCPQVDLNTSSIRPARESPWFESLEARVLAGVHSCQGRITVHVGNWTHDVSQINKLPRKSENLGVKLYSINSHRLAIALDRSGELLPLIRGAILNQMGLSGGRVRISNMF